MRHGVAPSRCPTQLALGLPRTLPLRAGDSGASVPVASDGESAVAWLQPDWPAPVGERCPVYLLHRDGSHERLPLERPAVFTETLGIEP